MDPTGSSGGRGAAGARRHALRVTCLWLPFAGLLLLPLYARVTPRLAGIPFFYWYQFAWIPGCSLFLLAAYLLRSPSRAIPGRRPRG